MSGSNISSISNDSGEGASVIKIKGEILSRRHFLKDKTIGISISESDNLSELGYGVSHLRDVAIEIARYIVACGGKLAYGGDMRVGGFTQLIFELLAYYKADKSLAPSERFHSYLAYPISTTVSKANEAELRHNVTFKRVSPPTDLNTLNINEYLPPDTVENLYVWSRSLTKMREEMERECDARIFVGGRTDEFKGKYPGVLEEFLIAIKNNHPVYLIGAFGGMTKDIIDALSGKQPVSLTDSYYSNIKAYNEFVLFFNEKHSSNVISYNDCLLAIQKIGLKEIASKNGLSFEDNLRLTTTPHISEVIYLVLKGLTNSFRD